MSWFSTPQHGVNYDIIVGLQAIGSIICVVLAIAQFVIGIEIVKGYFFVFSPFLLNIFWQYSVRSRWLET
jgi:hypothetical protein